MWKKKQITNHFNLESSCENVLDHEQFSTFHSMRTDHAWPAHKAAYTYARSFIRNWLLYVASEWALAFVRLDIGRQTIAYENCKYCAVCIISNIWTHKTSIIFAKDLQFKWQTPNNRHGMSHKCMALTKRSCIVRHKGGKTVIDGNAGSVDKDS